MGRLVQILVGLAAIAVILVSYLWVTDRETARAEAERAEAAVRSYESNARLSKCHTEVNAWNSGNKALAESRYGDNAENAIRLCESLIKIDELSRSKPSE